VFCFPKSRINENGGNFEYERPAQKNIISPVPKGAEGQKGDKNVKQPSLKRKFLIKVSLTRANFNQAYFLMNKWRTTAICRRRLSVTIFTTQKWLQLTCTSITSWKIHFKSSQSSNPLQKSHTEPILWFAWIPIAAFDNYEVGDRRFVSSIRQTAHFSTQNDFPVPPFIWNIILSIKKSIYLVKLTKKCEVSRVLFGLKPRQTHRYFRRSIEVRTA